MVIIARIFGMAVQNYKRSNKDSSFTEFEAFLANQEPSLHDEEALSLIQQIFKDQVPFNESKSTTVHLLMNSVITLANYRVLNGMILRNTQSIIPVSDLHYSLEQAPEEIQSKVSSLHLKLSLTTLDTGSNEFWILCY
jgi:hypothetical protein